MPGGSEVVIAFVIADTNPDRAAWTLQALIEARLLPHAPLIADTPAILSARRLSPSRRPTAGVWTAAAGVVDAFGAFWNQEEERGQTVALAEAVNRLRLALSRPYGLLVALKRQARTGQRTGRLRRRPPGAS